MNSDNYSKNIQNEKIQNIVIENRKKLSISGVDDVLSFDDQIVILDTSLGMLTIKGSDLRINKLSLDTSDVMINGNINNIIYSDKQEKSNTVGILGKIFK